MDHFLVNWLVLVTVMAVGLASPGPDFIMTVRNSIRYSRKSGVMTAVGLGLGVGVHVSYCLGGLALIISQSIMLFNVLKFIGAGYLFYVGFKALKSKGFSQDDEANTDVRIMGGWKALRSGFITNLFNPKATMFFLAIFTQVVDPHVGFAIQVIYGATCVLMTMAWFSIVATVLTAPAIRSKFLTMSKWIDRTCGGLFIALGIKLAVSKI